MADKVAKLPSLVNNLITNQGVTLFPAVWRFFVDFNGGKTSRRSAANN